MRVSRGGGWRSVRTWVTPGVDPEVASLVRGAAEKFAVLAAGGFALHDVVPAWGPKGAELVRGSLARPRDTAGAVSAAMGGGDGPEPGRLHPRRIGRHHAANAQDLRVRKFAYIAEIQSFFEDWDFLITPTVSVAAFPAERLIPAHWPQHPWDWLQWAEFSHPFNMSWNPAATVPCGFTAEGLPVGLQIVGRRFDDLGVLQASAAFERALPWADKRPSLPA